MSVGFVTDDGVTTRQCCGMFADESGLGTTEVRGAAMNNRCGYIPEAQADTLDYSLLAENFTATQVEITTKDSNAIAADWGIIAMKLGSTLKATCGVVDGPTDTNPTVYTATELPGMAGVPQFIMQVLTLIETENTLATDRTAGGFGVRMATADEEFTYSINSEDAQGTSDTEQGSHSSIAISDHDGTTGLAGSLTSMDSDGWTDTYGTVDAALDGVKWPTLVITDDVPAAGGLPAGSLSLLGCGL